VIWHFNWLADTIETSHSIHVLDAEEWDHTDANLTIYTDESLMGLGFVIPEKCLGFYASTPTDLLHPTIFYFEALTIASAVLWASKLTPPAHHLLIYMDSLNCINIFNTLSAHDRYNDVLLFTMHILISYNISLHVFHIPGHDNTIADTLS